MSDKNFIVTVVSGLALVTFVFVMRFLPDFIAWEGWTVCETPNCNLQGWLSALSGWAAAVAAAVTLFGLFDQVREQRRQTDFSVGDGMPTMDAVEHLSDRSELVVRIVNWNRRGVVIRALDPSTASVFLFPSRLEIDGRLVPHYIDVFDIKPFAIRGWEDRSKAPHFCEIRLQAWADTDLETKENWLDVPKVFAHVQILGDRHKTVRLSADTGIATDFAS